MSDLKQICIADYQEYVALRDMNSELKRALKTHERVPSFLQNLVKELRKVPFEISRETIKRCVYDLTELFIKCVEMKADEAHMSDAKRAAIKAEEYKKKELKELTDAFLDGGQTDVNRTEKGETERTTLKV